MKYLFCTIGWFLSVFQTPAQTVAQQLAAATKLLLADPQMKHATLGFTVVNSESGQKVYEWNGQAGLAPASCQKIITSATAFELLGAAFRYKTELAYVGSIKNGTLTGNLHVTGYGDPTLGSWRYVMTGEDKVMNQWMSLLQIQGIKKINGMLTASTKAWEKETLPGGWIWDDIGNYYGAGAAALNWRENQYDMVLHAGAQPGDPVRIVKTVPILYSVNFESELRAGEKGSGDNAFIYLPPFSHTGYVRGTIPAGEKAFTISGSFPDPAKQFLNTLAGKLETTRRGVIPFQVIEMVDSSKLKNIHTHWSPTLDSINYWFMKKSINLYGEALLKTMAHEKTGLGSTDKGVELVKEFWKTKGIESAALRIQDGSGLSPQNRLTSAALVQVLQYARNRPWFPFFYDALPLFNQMKLKSGTIGGAKSFAGYHTAQNGTSYTLAVMVNNYDGSAGEIVKKLFKVLDELK